MPTPGKFQPGKVHFRIKRLDVHLAVAHLDNQQPLFIEVIRRLGEHATHQVQTIGTAGKAQLRLVVILLGHVGKVFGINIGRVGHDQVETLIRQAAETVTLYAVDPVFQAMAFDVLVGHFQRLERQVGKDHFGKGENLGAGNTDTTGTGAQVENARRLRGQPRFEAIFDQLADRRTGYQHAFVDNERHPAEPRLAQQVGGRYAFFDTPGDQLLYMNQLLVFKTAVQIAVGNFPRQVDSAQHQEPRFVPGVVGTMPEKQLFLMETADSPTDMVAQGAQAGSDHGRLLGIRPAILPVNCRF
ncbi:hypothetical protein D9M71_469240 [compost metagenome]